MSFKAVSRAKGHSAVSKSAYRAAKKLHDQRLDKTFDFSKKSDVFYKEIISPAKTKHKEILIKENMNFFIISFVKNGFSIILYR